MTKFENNSGAAQIMKRRGRIDLWIHNRDALRHLRFGFMVIEHNYVHTAFAKIDNLRSRRCPTVERDEELRMILFDATLNTLATQTVAFFHPQRQKQIRRTAVSAQRFEQSSDRRHSVDIVIAEKNNSVTPI